MRALTWLIPLLLHFLYRHKAQQAKKRITSTHIKIGGVPKVAHLRLLRQPRHYLISKIVTAISPPGVLIFTSAPFC